MTRPPSGTVQPTPAFRSARLSAEDVAPETRAEHMISFIPLLNFKTILNTRKRSLGH